MEQFTFKYIDLTGCSRREIMERAEDLAHAMETQFPGDFPLQDAIDTVIDAAAEYAQ